MCVKCVYGTCVYVCIFVYVYVMCVYLMLTHIFSETINLVPRVLFVWPRAEENPGKGCENNPQFVDYFVTWYV